MNEETLPDRIVVGDNGAYWRDYGDHYSMCPVSDDNEPVEIVAVYIRVKGKPLPAPAAAGLDAGLLARALLAADEKIAAAYPEERDNLINPEGDQGRSEYADMLAAEYARLAQEAK